MTNYLTAPTFAKYTLIGEPYEKGNKLYSLATNPKTGKQREIRLYLPDEFRRLYQKKDEQSTDEEEAYPAPFPLMKHARGFDKGPILVIRNETPEDEWFLRKSVARYAVGIGWYVASEDTWPVEEAPPRFKYLLLTFDEFKRDDDFSMKKPSEVAKILQNKAREGEWFNFGA